MVAASIVSLSNRSLADIGARASISAINDTSPESRACKALFVPTFQVLAREANWNCLARQMSPSLVAAAKGTPENQDGTGAIPYSPWSYAYEIPVDCLKVRYLIPGNQDAGIYSTPMTTVNNQSYVSSFNTDKIRFEVASGVDSNKNPIQIILTNIQSPKMIYTADLSNNPEVWDASFQQAFVASLGASLVPALNLNLSLAQLQLKKADTLIAQARSSDGNEGYTSMDHVPDFISARGGNYLFMSNIGYTGSK